MIRSDDSRSHVRFSIPRESGDDPGLEPDTSSPESYSPRERG